MKKKEKIKFEEAVWQYLIDHSIITKAGDYRIQFIIPDKKALFYRIKARERGEFKRKDIKEMQVKSKKLHDSFYIARNKANKKTHEINQLLKSRNIIDRLAYYSVVYANKFRKLRVQKLLEVN